MKNFSLLLLLLFAIVSCKNPETKTNTDNTADDESARVNKFFDQSYDEAVDRDPERQTYLGIKKDYFKWTDRSDAHAMEENEINKRELEFLHKNFDFSKLDE